MCRFNSNYYLEEEKVTAIVVTCLQSFISVCIYKQWRCTWYSDFILHLRGYKGEKRNKNKRSTILSSPLNFVFILFCFFLLVFNILNVVVFPLVHHFHGVDLMFLFLQKRYCIGLVRYCNGLIVFVSTNMNFKEKKTTSMKR